VQIRKVAEKKSVKTMGRGDLGIQYINRIDRVAATDAHIHKPAPPPRPVKPATADLQKGPAKLNDEAHALAKMHPSVCARQGQLPGGGGGGAGHGVEMLNLDRA
jgi:hypothetical protein